MKENETYYQIKREEWSQYEGAHPFTMTREELAHLTSLNDRISLQDVQEVYVPMLDYFDLYFKKHIELRTECGRWEEYDCPFDANDATTTLPE